jgi:hypothetical protein
MNRILYFIVILVVLAAAIPAFAVTRFYLPSSGTSDITPTFETGAAGWTDILTATPGHLRCRRVLTYTATGTKSSLAATIGRFLFNQYVSDPIAAQTIGGGVSGEMAGIVSHTSGVTAYTAIIIKVVSNNGSTTRGTLLSMKQGNTVIPPTTAAGRWTPPPTTLNTVTSENGDRIVIEVGVTAEVMNNPRLATCTYLDNSTDLTEGGASTLNPWVEFNQDILFPSVTMIE